MVEGYRRQRNEFVSKVRPNIDEMKINRSEDVDGNRSVPHPEGYSDEDGKDGLVPFDGEDGRGLKTVRIF